MTHRAERSAVYAAKNTHQNQRFRYGKENCKKERQEVRGWPILGRRRVLRKHYARQGWRSERDSHSRHHANLDLSASPSRRSIEGSTASISAAHSHHNPNRR